MPPRAARRSRAAALLRALLAVPRAPPGGLASLGAVARAHASLAPEEACTRLAASLAGALLLLLLRLGVCRGRRLALDARRRVGRRDGGRREADLSKKADGGSRL
jgi:hypothetical protein